MALERPEEGEIAIKDLTYLELINHIEKGHVHIPVFQRKFVWNPKKILDLLDSIYRGYPIGSVILWITEEEFSHSEAIGKENKSGLFGGARFFVIDGQQRLKSLYYAAKSKNIKIDGNELNINVRFDLDEEGFVFEDDIRNRKRSMYRIPGAEDGIFFEFLEVIEEDDIEEYRERKSWAESTTNSFLWALEQLGIIRKEEKSRYSLTHVGKEVLDEQDSERMAAILVNNVQFVKKTLEIIENEPGITRKEARHPFHEEYGSSKDTAYREFGRRCRWLRFIGHITKEDGGYYLTEKGKQTITHIRGIEENILRRYIPLEKILVEDGELDLEYLFKFSEQRREKIEKVRKQFNNYPFSFIIVNKESWSEVIDIFERINTKQQRLTIVDLMMAKTWREGEFNLREKLSEFKNEIGEDIPEVTILKIASMNLSGKCTKEDMLSLDTTEFVNSWKKCLESLRKTIDFIKSDLNISSLDLLPYPDLLVPLSKFYHIFGNQATSKRQKKNLKKWFWRASVSNRFDAAVDSKLEDDKNIMESIAKGESPEYNYTYPQRSLEDIIERKYSLRNAFVKTLLCMYSSLEPKNIVDSSPVSNDSFSKYKSREMHHVFPRNYLRDKDVEKAKIDSIVNIMFLPANVHKEGEFKQKPSEYLNTINNEDLQEDLKTHLIPNLEESGLLENDFEKFLHYRAKQIKEKLRDLTEEKKILEEGALTPEQPFSNEMRIRHIIRDSESYVYWLDKYFTRRGLEFLVQEVNPNYVDEIKILTGTAQTDHNLRKEFKKFQEEMENKGINVQMRILKEETAREIHDRWLVDENRSYNIPSINTIGRGQHAEINKSSSRPPFEDWWEDSIDIIGDWNEVQKLIN